MWSQLLSRFDYHTQLRPLLLTDPETGSSHHLFTDMSAKKYINTSIPKEYASMDRGPVLLKNTDRRNRHRPRIGNGPKTGNGLGRQITSTAASLMNDFLRSGFVTKSTTVILLSQLFVPAIASGTHVNQTTVTSNIAPQSAGIRLTIWSLVGLVAVFSGRVSEALQRLVAPVMGGSSVLFVILRNDGSVPADIAWM
jgi:hypothetical protein